jgi:hypothetical protein
VICWILLEPSLTISTTRPKGFDDSLEDAADVFQNLLPSEDLRRSFNTSHHGLLTTGTDQDEDFAIPDAAEVVADLYSDDNGAPEWQHFVSCLLMTKSAWNPNLSLGELIVIAFVHIFTTCIHIKRRTLFEQRDKRACYATDWPSMSRRYINGFAGFLCRVVVSGPWSAEQNTVNAGLYTVDTPMYALVCVPILRMFKRCFGRMFRVDTMFKTTPDKFIKTFKDRARTNGCFSLAYLKWAVRNCGHDDQFSFEFCKGVYWPLYRSLTLLSPQLAFNKFDILNDTRLSIGRSQNVAYWMRIDDPETDLLRKLAGLRIRLVNNGTDELWYHAHPVTQPANRDLPNIQILEFEETFPELEDDESESS